MSEMFDKISSCPQVTEWINPYNERLVQITGLQAPVDARSLREDWCVERSAVPELLRTLGRLLLPNYLTDKAKSSFSTRCLNGNSASGIVSFEFEDPADWRLCFPFSAQTLVFDRHGIRGNASIALCDQIMGLAVIGMDYYEEEVFELLVQPVKQLKFEQILVAS